MGGFTGREGRVEVCVGSRRWRTVCQELARAVSTSLKVKEIKECT